MINETPHLQSTKITHNSNFRSKSKPPLSISKPQPASFQPRSTQQTHFLVDRTPINNSLPTNIQPYFTNTNPSSRKPKGEENPSKNKTLHHKSKPIIFLKPNFTETKNLHLQKGKQIQEPGNLATQKLRSHLTSKF